MPNAQAKDSWLVPGDLETLQHKLVEFLEEHKFKITEIDQNSVFARCGSKFITKLFGHGLYTPAQYLSMIAKIKLVSVNNQVRIEAVVEADLPPIIGLFKKKYEELVYKRYEKFLPDLLATIRQFHTHSLQESVRSELSYRAVQEKSASDSTITVPRPTQNTMTVKVKKIKRTPDKNNVA